MTWCLIIAILFIILGVFSTGEQEVKKKSVSFAPNVSERIIDVKKNRIEDKIIAINDL